MEDERMLTRTPVYSEEAERGCLGSVLLDGWRLAPFLEATGAIDEWFYIPANRIVFSAMMELHEAGRPIDALTVTQRLKERDQLDAIGGALALDKLIDDTPTAAHAEYYTDLVRQKYLLRCVQSVSSNLEREVYETADADQFLSEIPSRYTKLSELAEKKEPTNAEIMESSIVTWEEAADSGVPAYGLPFPFELMTEMLCGHEPGLLVLAGRPSTGKTSLEGLMADTVCRHGACVLRGTLDSSREELLQRMISMKAGVSLPKLKHGYGGKCSKQMAVVREMADVIADYDMVIRDDITEIRQLCGWVRSEVAKRGVWTPKDPKPGSVGLVTFDYIQLLRASELGRSQMDANIRVGHVSGMLKLLSLQLGVPVVVLSQLRRGGHARPELSDLRDSGAIEQDASKVVILSKDEDEAEAMEKEQPGITKGLRPVICDVAKHKNGETGVIPLWLRASYFKFDVAQISMGEEQRWCRPGVETGEIEDDDKDKPDWSL